MNKIFYTATALLGTIPGLTVLVANLGVPPGQKPLFGGVVEACGVFTLLTLWLYRKRLRQVAKFRMVRWTICSFLGFMVLLAVFLFMKDKCLIVSTKPHYAKYGTVYFPLWLNGNLRKKVVNEGSRVAIVDKYGPQVIDEKIGKECSDARSITTIFLLAIFSGVFTLLTLAFGLFGFRLDPPLANNKVG